ncbi:MAG: FAD binding domain-containing protein [Propionibacteriaceae bacterium]
MRPFEYLRPVDVDEAIDAVSTRPEAAFLSGGTNLVDHMRLGVAKPDVLVDVGHLPLSTVEELPDGGLRVGATVPNSDLAADPRIRSGWPVLSRALLSGASGQLRNAATTGGNLLQRTRCPYFQDVTTACNKRSPGTGCSAREGHHREAAVFGASEQCIAVHPSDMAVGLLALDAVVRVRGPKGERVLALDEFHRLPEEHAERDTVLEHGELITAIDLPASGFARCSTYRKVRERASFAFALVSVAAAVELVDGQIKDLRLALGGVAHKPWRAARAEAVLRGASPSDELFTAAIEAELSRAEPLPGNEYKIELVRRTVPAVLRELTGREGSPMEQQR